MGNGVHFTEAAKLGFKWDYRSKQYDYGRECLASYVNGEYDDIKGYYNKSNSEYIND